MFLTMAFPNTHVFKIGQWSIGTKERDYHGNRMKVSASFKYSDNGDIIDISPEYNQDDLDDCNGDKMLDFLDWLRAHPISKETLSDWKLEDVSEFVYPHADNHRYYTGKWIAKSNSSIDQHSALGSWVVETRVDLSFRIPKSSSTTTWTITTSIE